MKGKADVKMKFYLWLSKKKIQLGDSVKTRNKDREREEGIKVYRMQMNQGCCYIVFALTVRIPEC